MSLREHLSEPWGIVTAALLGGLGGAVTAAIAPAAVLGLPVGVGIAGVVYGVKVGVALLTEHPSGPGRRIDAQLPEPARGSAAERWLRRAEKAVETLRRQTRSPAEATLREQIADVDDQAVAILADLRRLAGQVTLIDRTAAQIDTRRLRQEYTGIERSLHGLPAGPLRAERERALRAVADQIDVASRLAGAGETLLARAQSAVLGLEGLVARMAELLALHATADSASLTATRVAELTGDLEGVRAGLAEAEEVSRSTLAGGSAGTSPPNSNR